MEFKTEFIAKYTGNTRQADNGMLKTKAYEVMRSALW
ncbi:hypothetical protein N474_20090 [Pseudoalteromonas luteoviolacea CPMOR-2]|uniref:Uncharacterized protein n=1 Tax=Pseudoalteromonas luteoviolacea DSM 6061 TaxID=1365250 RepID=A0A166UKN2_9GAMM|nr:hypothetical protein N475_23930 [Pseudoalteromonas luteoviolacea DSM 6061]KZN53635.1 hypothetical protein N474_20090 [Pseudoalteromonas luteoviolacea CPMOR-2]